MENINDTIITIIVESLGIDREKVILGASIRDDLGADSLDAVELIMAIEDKFGIDLSDDEMVNLYTVQSVIDITNEKLNAKKS